MTAAPVAATPAPAPRRRVSGRPARENPFRVSRVLRLRYRLDERAWEDLLERLATLHLRAALVGPEGSGKTTLLEDIEQRFEKRGWSILRVRLCRERRDPSREEWARLETAGKRDLVTIDGMEQLSWCRWRRVERLSKRAAGLIATSHRAARLPTLRQHRTSLQLFQELVAELVGREEVKALGPELDRLFEVHRGNLRICLRSLYDRWACSPVAATAEW